MRQVKENEADKEQGKGQGHHAMNFHGRDPHDKGVNGPDHQEPANIGGAGMVNVKMVENENDPKSYPETPVRDKSTVAEVVAAFELLETGEHLGQSSEYKAKRNNWPDITQSDIVNLQQHGSEGKPCKTDNRRISLNCFSIRHDNGPPGNKNECEINLDSTALNLSRCLHNTGEGKKLGIYTYKTKGEVWSIRDNIIFRKV